MHRVAIVQYQHRVRILGERIMLVLHPKKVGGNSIFSSPLATAASRRQPYDTRDEAYLLAAQH